jgi:hypothetical protein
MLLCVIINIFDSKSQKNILHFKKTTRLSIFKNIFGSNSLQSVMNKVYIIHIHRRTGASYKYIRYPLNEMLTFGILI